MAGLFSCQMSQILAIKDPGEVKDYQIDWAGESPGPRLVEGETIASSEWTVEEGITVDSEAADDTTATIWVSGGVAGQKYRLTNEIMTSDGRTYRQTIWIPVNSR